ncbi:MBL fold metallo-hydrolase [Candidatus Pelagibacter sp.]|nr:MBL fold metallo-hydrolase [Candidatus Pelagibacter sp.]
MKIKLYRSATVSVNIDGFKILQDPWLVDGEYYGSWSHYPPFDIKRNIDEINSHNIIYISHIHPDHCSDSTIKLINKNIPIYIHKFHAKFLKFKLERMGFKIIELENGKRHEVHKDIYLNIFAADNCDPQLCYKFMGCSDMSAKEESQQIDTLAVISSKKNVLLNVNDCPFDLAKSTFDDIHKQYEKIDLLLTGYQNASPYPQCFDNLNTEEKINIGKEISISCLNKALSFIKNFKPKYFLPFAGTYALTGSLCHLNDLRSVPTIDDAYNFLSQNQNFSQPIKINPESSFCLTTQSVDIPYKKFDKKDYDNYVNLVLKKKRLSYEQNSIPDFDSIYNLCQKAYVKYLDKKIINNIKLSTDIYIQYFNKLIKIPKEENSKLSVIDKNKIDQNSKFVIYRTDPRLLELLLNGPRFAHWNNAEIGSHVNFYRKPNIFERDVYASMCYFHC